MFEIKNGILPLKIFKANLDLNYLLYKISKRWRWINILFVTFSFAIIVLLSFTSKVATMDGRNGAERHRKTKKTNFYSHYNVDGIWSLHCQSSKQTQHIKTRHCHKTINLYDFHLQKTLLTSDIPQGCVLLWKFCQILKLYFTFHWPVYLYEVISWVILLRMRFIFLCDVDLLFLMRWRICMHLTLDTVFRISKKTDQYV